MVLKEIKALIPTSDKPIIKMLHKGESFKVIALGFAKNVILKEHKALLPSKLTCIEGQVIYTEGDKKVTLQQYETTDIPPGILHAVEAKEDSICILTQGI
jgi:quercetin dioxygenase-like cupin family protein